MTPLAVAVAAVIVLGVLGVLGAVTAVLFRLQPPTSGGAETPQLRDLAAEVERLKIAVAGLPSLWESEANRAEEAHEAAKREHARARAARSAAERARASQDEDDDDGDELPQGVFPFDADERENGRMQPMRAHVEDASSDDLAKRAIAAGWSPWL